MRHCKPHLNPGKATLIPQFRANYMVELYHDVRVKSQTVLHKCMPLLRGWLKTRMRNRPVYLSMPLCAQCYLGFSASQQRVSPISPTPAHRITLSPTHVTFLDRGCMAAALRGKESL